LFFAIFDLFAKSIFIVSFASKLYFGTSGFKTLVESVSGVVVVEFVQILSKGFVESVIVYGAVAF